MRDDNGDVKMLAPEDVLAPGIVYIVLGKGKDLPPMKRKRQVEPKEAAAPAEPEEPKPVKKGRKSMQLSADIEFILKNFQKPEGVDESEILKQVDTTIDRLSKRIQRAREAKDEDGVKEAVDTRAALNELKVAMAREAGGRGVLLTRAIGALQRVEGALTTAQREVGRASADVSLCKEVVDG